MDRKSGFVQKFREEIASLLEVPVFKPGTASLQDHIDKGYGDLAEGIRTTMKIGDLSLVGLPEDSPEEGAVHNDYGYFYEGNEKAPLASLLPTLTVTGTEETKPGSWRVLYESDKSRLWAFLRLLLKMKEDSEVGLDHQGARFQKIVTDLLETLPVVIVKMQKEDELWAEWARGQSAGHVDLEHSPERTSVRFLFFTKLRETLKNQLKEMGRSADVTSKELFDAYVDAEKNKKFKTAKGLSGAKRDNELSQLMKFGEFVLKIGMMPCWKALEVLPEGKTAFFAPAFGNLGDPPGRAVDRDRDCGFQHLVTLNPKPKP